MKISTRTIIICTFGIFLTFQSTAAEFGLATGFISTQKRRPIPGAYALLGSENWSVSYYLGGYQTSLQYYAGHLVSIYKLYPIGDFFGGEVISGFGWGMHYAEMGFREVLTDPSSVKSNFTTGPAIRIHWKFLYPFFMGLESTFGLGGLPNLILVSQNVTIALVGVLF